MREIFGVWIDTENYTRLVPHLSAKSLSLTNKFITLCGLSQTFHIHVGQMMP
jgi:hypothetical protein